MSYAPLELVKVYLNHRHGKCASCAWFCEFDKPTIGKPSSTLVQWHGQCRRYPPNARMIKADDLDQDLIVMWPEVEGGAFCGEHREVSRLAEDIAFKH